MPRFRRDLDDEDFFDRDEVERRKAERAEIIARNEEVERQRLRQEEVVRTRAAERSRQVNRDFLIREYAQAGVKPLQVDDEGTPRCGIGLLFSMGWRVEEMADGERVLVAPPHLQQGKKKTNDEAGD